MNTDLLSFRNILVIVFLAFIWLVWGKKFAAKHVAKSADTDEGDE